MSGGGTCDDNCASTYLFGLTRSYQLLYPIHVLEIQRDERTVRVDRLQRQACYVWRDN